MDWAAPAIVLRASGFGEADALVDLLTAEHGLHRGLARGGASRRQRAMWDAGNIVEARWSARTSEQLGSLTAELVEAPFTRLLHDPVAMATMAAACAVATGALAERVAVPDAYAAMLLLLARLVNGEAGLAAFVRWEVALLADLGFGLDLSRCALTGAVDGLGFVSPRTGRAVALEAAGAWEGRLLPLPSFLWTGEDAAASAADLLAGLRLTGHFLARDAFGQRHQGVPAARARLVDLVAVE